ncbi:hypothetical protein CLAIMM_08218 [Cladophialophora immunda]|nr:hypothetical protein CLAIMM_08218 [Cladophialophora immunda]
MASIVNFINNFWEFINTKTFYSFFQTILVPTAMGLGWGISLWQDNATKIRLAQIERDRDVAIARLERNVQTESVPALGRRMEVALEDCPANRLSPHRGGAWKHRVGLGQFLGGILHGPFIRPRRCGSPFYDCGSWKQEQRQHKSNNSHRWPQDMKQSALHSQGPRAQIQDKPPKGSMFCHHSMLQLSFSSPLSPGELGSAIRASNLFVAFTAAGCNFPTCLSIHRPYQLHNCHERVVVSPTLFMDSQITGAPQSVFSSTLARFPP